MRLQGENLKLSDQIGEINVKNNQKVAVMSREVSIFSREVVVLIGVTTP